MVCVLVDKTVAVCLLHYMFTELSVIGSGGAFNVSGSSSMVRCEDALQGAVVLLWLFLGYFFVYPMAS